MGTDPSFEPRACPQLQTRRRADFLWKTEIVLLITFLVTFFIFVPAGRPRAAPMPRSAYADGYIRSEKPIFLENRAHEMGLALPWGLALGPSRLREPQCMLESVEEREDADN